MSAIRVPSVSPRRGVAEVAGVEWPDKGLCREAFIDQVSSSGIAHYRDLPWRHIDDPYAVLVSEVMLQQTQVARVERFWRRFLGAFPSVDALAAASASDVLEMWQGLGYNRRALSLKRAADICSHDMGGALPDTYEGLVALPGVGPATAAGVMAFAHQQPGVYLETNVRAVCLHDLFPHEERVPDRVLEPLVADVCPSAPAPGVRIAHPDPLASPRDWYYAFLDYGAHLKSIVVNPSRRSSHYARQSAFEGSRRQKRSWIVRRVLAADAEEGVAVRVVSLELDRAEREAGRELVDEGLFSSILDDLVSEGFFRRDGDVLRPC